MANDESCLEADQTLVRLKCDQAQRLYIGKLLVFGLTLCGRGSVAQALS